MNDNKKLVSVIIPALNAESSIGAVLESLTTQDLPHGWSMEILVVDGNAQGPSPDRTREIARIFHVKIWPSPGTGAGANRNEGIRRASGDILIFLDADCCPVHSSLVARHVAHHEDRDPRQVVVGMRGYAMEDRTAWSDIDHCCNSSEADPLFLKEGSLAPVFFASCNFSCLPETFRVAGLFDERFKRNEDTFWALGAAKAGCRFHCYKDISVQHHCETSWKRTFRHSFRCNAELAMIYYHFDPSVAAKNYPQQLLSLWKVCWIFLKDGLPLDTTKFMAIRENQGLSRVGSIVLLPLVWVQVLLRVWGIGWEGFLFLWRQRTIS